MGAKICGTHLSVPRVTDDALFGGGLAAAIENEKFNHKSKCKCSVCGTRERRHKRDGIWMSNFCAALGACGKCLMAGRA
jgi:hypothetical protein